MSIQMPNFYPLMLRIRLSLLILIAAGSASAQASFDPVRPADPKAVRHNILRRQYEQACPNAKTTVLKQRFIGLSRYVQGGLLDTSHYYYSGLRGSRLYTWDEYDLFTSPYGNDGRLTISCDSGFRWNRSSPNDPFELIQHAIYRYNATDQDTFFQQDNVLQTYRLTYTYNTAGMMDRIYYYDTLNSGNGNFLLKNVFHLTYDAQNRLLLDSSYFANTSLPAAKNTYQYDAAGNLIASVYYTWVANAWAPGQQVLFTYTPSNLLQTAVYQTYANGQWNNYDKDSNSYAGPYSLPTYYEAQFWGNNRWIRDFSLNYHFGPNGNYDTFYYAIFPTPSSVKADTSYKRSFEYDAGGRLLLSREYAYAGNGVYNQPHAATNYYYETYNDPTGVPGAPAAAPLRLFPNPVTGAAPPELDLSAFSAGTPVQIKVLNAAGQLVLEQQATGGGKVGVTMTELVPGIYLVQVQDHTGRMQTARLEKQ